MGNFIFFDKPDAELYFVLVLESLINKQNQQSFLVMKIFLFYTKSAVIMEFEEFFVFTTWSAVIPKCTENFFFFFGARKALNSWNMRNLLSLGLESYISWNRRNFFLTKHKKFFNFWARKFHISKYEIFLNLRLKKFFRKGFFYYYYLSLENSLLEYKQFLLLDLESSISRNTRFFWKKILF